MCEHPVQVWFLGQSLIVMLRRDGASPAIKSFTFLARTEPEESHEETNSSKGENESGKKSCSCSSNVFCACSLCWFFIPNPRGLWIFPRSSQWWEDVVLGSFEQHDWMENFRMSRDTSQYLCDQLRPLIQKQNMCMRESVSTECRLAITLWVLATPGEYRSVAHLFGLARCTVCEVVHETCRHAGQLYGNFFLFMFGSHLEIVWRRLWGGLRCPSVCWLHWWVHTCQLYHLQWTIQTTTIVKGGTPC